MPTKSSPTTATGWVSFIGTGPGDPDLITVRAVELIRAADVVITESAQQVDLVAQLTAGATPEVIESDFGGAADLAQAAKAKHVLAAAKAGRRVARLVSGDAALWSSASDEATLVAKAGIGFEIVPGVSPAAAVPTYAGMPLGAVDAVGVIRCAGTRDWVNRFDWAAHLATPTLVILGAAECLSAVVESLLAAGKPGRTPVAVTSGGTTTEQATVSATLDSIVMETRAARLDDAVLVVGDVVAARDSLSWFESKPLFGWRVLVPRTKEQAGELSASLRGHGAVADEVPTISVEPPRNPLQMDKALRGLVEGRYEWIAFTSVNAVKAVREKFEDYGLDARAFSGLKIAAVGDKTAAAIAAWGLRADLVPSGEQSAAGLLADWPEYDEVLDPINRVFLPRADIATENLVAGLIDLGWEVDDVTAYRTVRAAPPPAPIREAIKTGKFDAVVFTSSSTVRNLVGIA
ncbi:MAG TPA: uroporphyrinogen-III synthase, partial [Marmoricola sp.]|nr:uroporphyrinogen-III synthase [Marmoricola sp.]